jgi:hypothetical protein
MQRVRIRQAKPAFKKVREIGATKKSVIAERTDAVMEAQSIHEDGKSSEQKNKTSLLLTSATPIIERLPVGKAQDMAPLIRQNVQTRSAPAPEIEITAEEPAPGRRGARLLESEVAEAPTASAPATTTTSETVSTAQVYATAAETYRSATPQIYTPAGQQQKQHDPGYRVELQSEPTMSRPIPTLQESWRERRESSDAGGVRDVRRDLGGRSLSADTRMPYEHKQYELPEEMQSKKKRQRQPWE